MQQQSQFALVCSFALALSACDANETDPCARAAAHVNSCTGAATVAAGKCDAEAAKQLRALDCTEVTLAVRQNVSPDSLFGTVDSIACAAGIARDCPDP